MPRFASFAQDVRFAVRSLIRRPGYAIPAVATLALGIGAVTTLFAVVYGVVLQPLPLPEPERLVRLYQAHPDRGEDRGGVAELDAEDWARGSSTVAALGVYSARADGLTLTGFDRAEKLPTVYVGGDFFAALGAAPALGRTLSASDLVGDDRVVVVSDGFWRRRLGGDPGVVGSTLTLDAEPMTVVGVMGPAFRFPATGIDVFAPLSLIPESSIPRQRFVRWLDAIGRLAPGATIADARQELSLVAERLAAEHPRTNETATAVTAEPLAGEMVAGVRPALLLLLAAVAALLLIACVNVANMMLARGVGRAGELAVRRALGASRGRVMGQLLTEGLVVALAGGALAAVGSFWSVEAAVALAADLLPRATEIHVDGTILGFSAATALLTALLAGLLPALRSTRPGIQQRLRSGNQPRRSARLFDGLVAVEVSLAMALAVTCILSARSLGSMLATDPGLATDRLLSVSLVIPDHVYPERPQYLEQHRRLSEALAGVPGVESVASIKVPPLTGVAGESIGFTAGQQEGSATWFPVSRGFFRTVGVPLRSGRDFDGRDDAEASLVALVNQSFVRSYFPDGRALGERLTVGENEIEVIGVVADARHEAIVVEPVPTLYFHQQQVPRRVVSYLLRSSGPPATLVPAARQAVAAVDPNQTIARIAPLADLVTESVGLPRMVAVLVALFSLLALALAAIGVYGVLSFTVAQRRREIGVRLALGADGSAVIATILRRGMAAVVVGAVAGLAIAALGSRWLGHLLYGVAAIDPASYALAAGVLLAVAFAACLPAARRAAATDPATVLRQS